MFRYNWVDLCNKMIIWVQNHVPFHVDRESRKGVLGKMCLIKTHDFYNFFFVLLFVVCEPLFDQDVSVIGLSGIVMILEIIF